MSRTDWAEYSGPNKRAWDEIAEVRSRSYHESTHTAGHFREGGSILDPRVVDAAGDVSDLRLLHLMCASGEETLSWSVLGASVVGIDISERMITLAQSKGTAAGLDTEFRALDVGALTADLQEGDFDVVYTANGVLTWLPDLSTWTATISRALRPGGRFILWEEHPVAACFDGEGGVPHLACDYFDKSVVGEVGWGHFDDQGISSETKFEFAWTLGDVVTAVAQAGLSIEHLTEYPSEEAWRFGAALGAARGLPGWFLLVARK